MKKVLILEDSKVILWCLENLVKEIDNNLVVFTSTNMKDACKCMGNYKINLFIVDNFLIKQNE